MARNRIESYLEARDPSLDRRLVPLPEKKLVLEKLLEDDETFCSESSDGGKDTAAQLFLRLRPTNREMCPNYDIAGNVFIVKPDASNGAKTTSEKHFTFSGIFDGYTSQQQIYESCIKGSIESETNLTVLTYGTSGSGKTFTLLGDVENPGIIPRSLENLFTFYGPNIHPEPAVKIVNGDIDLVDDRTIEVEEHLRNIALGTDADIRKCHSDLEKIIRAEHDFQSQNIPKKMVFIWISFAEIYNEIVYDLLVPIEQDPLRRKKLKISSNNEKVFIKDLTTINVRNALEAYTLLTKGIKRVTYGSTGINDHSSRSHCIFFVNIVTFQRPDTFTHVTHQFCDLAGSERQKKAGNIGTRLREANSINTSLTVLSRCLHAVHNNQQKKNLDVVPYRESKLTMLLRDPLLGREKITIIVNLSPVQQYFDENLNVLGFSNIAKSITFKPSAAKAVNSTRYSWFASHAASSSSSVLSTGEAEILYEENITLKSENERLRNEITRLENQLVRQEYELRKDIVEYFQKQLHEQHELWEERLKQKEIQLELYYEGKIAILKENNKRKLTENMEDSGRKKSTAVSSTIDLDDSDSFKENDLHNVSDS